ncbi:hypothetical protein [Pseudomonas sp. OIL-1]|uniref:hypothetical protein n=1 Tax=Pseudomonas sp. OIL-1 TaxID=2706126 RepID=UPI0013A727F5|nr:hypothetical protein [Pseudomonas sp. OIL-1]QIB52612.1 hypothetical protein G3M63_17115 [Pseudomonas sp. OIL-1]
MLMVGSIYKRDLSRPKHGLFAKRNASKEVKRVEKFLYQESLLVRYIRIMPILTVQLLQAYKRIDISVVTAMDTTWVLPVLQWLTRRGVLCEWVSEPCNQLKNNKVRFLFVVLLVADSPHQRF